MGNTDLSPVPHRYGPWREWKALIYPRSPQLWAVEGVGSTDLFIPRSPLLWAEAGAGSTDLSPTPPGSPGGSAPRCCFKRGLSAGEEGKHVQERLRRRLRISSVRGKNNNNKTTKIPLRRVARSRPLASPANPQPSEPPRLQARPRAAPGQITRRCRWQERHQAAHGLGRRSRQKSRIPASKDFLPQRGGEEGGEKKGGSNNFPGGGSSGEPACPSPAVHASIYCFNNPCLEWLRSGGTLGGGAVRSRGATTLGPGEQVRAVGLCSIPPC